MLNPKKIFSELKEKTKSIGWRIILLSGGRILIVLFSIGILSLLFSFSIRALNQSLFREVNSSSGQTELFHLAELETIASYWGIGTKSLLIETGDETKN